ncbi:hypothetical protein KY285_018019 [Solanum tuberosum]|nr:hypothetical protein KY284_019093 [Solanum tuberosum]KAH0703741.1 hypothetical protein KY285_018019 [Solanum tuberosum]
MIGDWFEDETYKQRLHFEWIQKKHGDSTGKFTPEEIVKPLKKDVSSTIAANVTKDSETLDKEQPVKVVPNQNYLITHSGDVPECGVELRETGKCSGGEVVMIIFNELNSIAEIRNVRSRLEGELDNVRRMVKKIEVKETLLYNGDNKRRLVLIPHPPRISCRYLQFTSYMINLPPSPNYHPGACGIIEREKMTPKVNQHYNPVVCRIVEREKRIRKVNQYYNSCDYLLWKDKLPPEINKELNNNKNERKNKGFALNRNKKDLPTPATSRNTRHPIPFLDEYQTLRHVPQGKILERCKSITGVADHLRKKKPSNKKDMTTEEIQKLNRGLDNLPKKELGAVAEIIKKRGAPYK